MKTRHQEKEASAEPTPEPQKRTGRKRRASTSSETSNQPTETITVDASQSKRRKRNTKSSQEPSQTAKQSHPQLERLDEEDQATANDTELAPPQERRVRFSQDAADDAEKPTATNLTPHVRKHTTHHRVTLSPAELKNGISPSHKLKAKSRASLPSSLTAESQPDVAGGLEIAFAPLGELIRERVKQRLQQKQDLFQIDGSDDVEMEEDMLVYRGHENGIAYPKLPTPPALDARLAITETIEERSETQTHPRLSTPDNKAEKERAAFEEAIKRLTREASDAKAALQILTIQLQSLGFGGEGTDIEAVVTSIRESFSTVRQRLELAIPGQVPSDASNSELVELVNQHISSLAEKTAAQDDTISGKDQLHAELAHEIDALVDRLTEAEIRKSKLETANSEFDAQAQEDERYIREMEERIRQIEKQHSVVEGLLSQNETQLTIKNQEVEELESTVDKLGMALEKYRAVEETLQELITRMEEQHKAALVKLESDHEAATGQITLQFLDETTKRQTAEADADDKQTVITDIELRYEEAQASLDTLRQQLADAQDAKAVERDARVAVEMELDEKVTFIADLESKVHQAEADLEDLQGQLSQLRDLNESERRQREAAETDLDDRNVKINDMDGKLHKQGLEANELRQKLFEIQMREKKSIKDMESAASEREEQFQSDMTDEIARREDAEALAADRARTIANLKQELSDVEERMRETLEDKDAEVAVFAATAKNLEEVLADARHEIDLAAGDLQEQRNEADARIAQLEGTISALEGDLSRQTSAVIGLERNAVSTAETHAIAIEERDDEIANKNHAIFTNLQQISLLEKEKTSLERRVESEAEAMLELQASKDDEIADLKSIVRQKQSEIEDLGVKATEVDSAWNEVLKERDAEILELNSTTTTSTTLIGKLKAENGNIRELFRSFVANATATTEQMRLELEAVMSAAVGKDELLREEGRRVLEEVEAMDVVLELPEQQTVVQVQHSQVKKVKKTTKKGSRDSAVAVGDSMHT